MSSTAFFESLPYIDPPASADALARAKSLIEAETVVLLSESSSSDHSDSQSQQSPPKQEHPRMPPPPSSPFTTPAMTLEDARVSSKLPLEGIDLSRYRAIDPSSLPSNFSSSSSSSNPRDLKNHNSALLKAVQTSYAQATHLALKTATLASLEQNGKNSWLLSNYFLEAELGALERDLADAKKGIDLVNLQRKQEQEGVAEEMRLLEQDWKAGVGKVLEIEVAIEGLRREGDELRRLGEGGGLMRPKD